MRMILGYHNGESLDQYERRVRQERRRRDLVREAHATGTADRLPLRVRDPDEAYRQAIEELRMINRNYRG